MLILVFTFNIETKLYSGLAYKNIQEILNNLFFKFQKEFRQMIICQANFYLLLARRNYIECSLSGNKSFSWPNKLIKMVPCQEK
jgi:hypothetical protein